MVFIGLKITPKTKEKKYKKSRPGGVHRLPDGFQLEKP